VFLFSLLGVTASTDTDIDQWLDNATLSLPPITLDTIVLGSHLDITLHAFQCKGLDIQTINAAPVQRHGFSGGATLQLSNLAVHTCAGDYSGKFGTTSFASGSFSFGIEHTNITLGILFDDTNSSRQRPLVFPTNMCKVALYFTQLHFQGTLASILNTLSHTIESLLHNAVANKICKQLQEIVAPAANKIFAPLVMSPSMPPPSSPVVLPVTTKRLIAWTDDVPVIQGILTAERRNDPFYPYANTNFSRALNHLIDLLCNGTGTLQVPLPHSLATSPTLLNVSGVTGSATGALTSATISGLGNLHSIGMNASQHVLQLYLKANTNANANANTKVINAAPSDSLAATVDVGVSVSFAPDSLLYAPAPLNISARVTLGVLDLITSINIMIAADYDAMNVLTFDGLQDVATAAAANSVERAVGIVTRSILAVNVTSSDVQAILDDVVVRQKHNGRLASQLTKSLSIGIACLLNVTNFRQRLFNNLYSAMEPTLRPALNVQLAAVLANATAQAPIDVDGSFQEPRPNVKITNSHVERKVVVMLFVAVAVSCAYVVVLPIAEQRCCSGTGSSRSNTALSKKFINNRDDLEIPLVAAAADDGVVDGSSSSSSSSSSSTTGNIDGETATSTAAKATSLASAYAGTWMRNGIPVLHIACATIGAWSLQVPVCDVRVRLTGGIVNRSAVVLDDSLLLYTFPQMVSDFWNSGSWMIAVLLVGGTAILPQFKGLLSVMVWSIPLPQHVRGYLLTLLDVIGRFVLVCQVFIMLVVATLRTTVDGIPGLKTDVVAEPIHSIAGATVGLLCMMVVSQWTLHLHEKVSIQQSKVDVHGRSPKTKATGVLLMLPSASFVETGAMVLLLLLTVVTVWMALTLELLEFRIDGIAGILLKSNGLSSTPDIKRISLLSLPGTVYQDTDEKWIAVFVSCAIVLFTVVAPIVCMLCWLLQWLWFLFPAAATAGGGGGGGGADATNTNVEHICSPHDLSTPMWVRWAAYITTYSYAWCAFDVAFASIGAASLEMDLVTQWIVKKQPVIGTICANMTREAGSTKMPPCVKVTGKLMGGGWWLLSAALLMLVVYSVTAKRFGVRST
jgi:hypothetical protein